MKSLNRMYILLLALFLLLANNVVLAGISRTVTLTSPGTLRSHFTIYEQDDVTRLTVSGPMNAEDFFYIRDYLSNMEMLDLRQADVENDEIPAKAFYLDWETVYLDSVYLPETLVKIGEEAFANCELMRWIYIPETVKEIDAFAFRYCTQLSRIHLPEGLISLKSRAFMGCEGLDSLLVPASVTYWEDGVFSGCTSLKSLELKSGLQVIGMQAFFLCYSLQSVRIPGSVKTIGQMAFLWCPMLKDVVLTEGLDSIGNLAFALCDSLTSVTIPATLKNIGFLPFYASPCTMNFKPGNPYLTFAENVLYNSQQTKLILCMPEKSGVFSLPATVDTIEPYALAGCVQLTKIELPPGLKAISENAFIACEGLENLLLPDSVSSIGTAAFTGIPYVTTSNPDHQYFREVDSVLFNRPMTKLLSCSYLKNGTYTIPNSVEIITTSSFNSCSELKELVMPFNLKTIELEAFEGCDKLKAIYLKNPVPIKLDSLFTFDIRDHCVFYVPKGSLNAYKNADTWWYFSSQLKEWDGVTDLNGKDKKKEVIRFSGNDLILEGVSPGSIVSVYALNGTLVKSLKSGGSETIQIPVQLKGVLLVQVGNKTYKVIH